MISSLASNFKHPIMNTLDWDVFANKFANLAHFNTNKEYLTNSVTFKQNSDLEKHYLELIHFQANYHENKDYYTSLFEYLTFDSKDLRTKIDELTKNVVLELSHINQLILILEKSETDNRDIKKIIQEFRLICEANGQEKIESHPLLKKITSEIISLESSIRSQVLRSEKSQDFDIVFERFVLLIPADNYSKSDGSILAHSRTGNTLYVEPLPAKSLNEKRIELLSERNQILFKLIRDILNKLNPFAQDIMIALKKLEKIDYFIALYHFNDSLNLATPTLNQDNLLEIKNLFHPLIPNPVKNNISLDSNQNLILSGANTGGKTVILKSITLSYLFTIKGLGVPASSANLYLPHKIFFYSQDGQNIQKGLSSFSSEVAFYLESLEQSYAGDLVVIDEIFNSTSSEEASALAYAFFKEFSQKEVKLIASTHHRSLKELIETDPGFTNAHMKFDLQNLKPLYKIEVGSYDSSHALSIFERVATGSIYQERLKNKAYQNLDSNIVEYEEKTREVQRALLEIEKEKAVLKKKNLEIEKRFQDIEGTLKLKRDKAYEKLDKEIEKIKREALAVLSKVENSELKKRNKVESTFNRLIPQKEQEVPTKDLAKPEVFILNEKYFSKKLNTNVILKEIRGNKTRVQTSLGIVNGKLDDLFKKEKEKRNKKREPSFYQVEHSHQEKIEYDCRGLRLDEFEKIIETALSHLLLGSLPFITIVHGHGEGILKNWLKKRVAQDQQFTLKPGPEGNDGMSIIELV